MTLEPLYGGIEAGGTKWVCAVGTGPDDIRDTAVFPTTSPEETLALAVDFFRKHSEISAIGIGTFGPLDAHRASPTFGYITTTPKPGWAHTDVAGVFLREFGIPVGFDTDVNTAALGEHIWGDAQGIDTFIYLTIGTGIGGGVMANGQIVHGVLHPEVGHMLLPHDWARDPYAGACPYHGDCWEGLAAGPALLGRWGQRGETLPADHEAWDLEAHYIALALMNITCMLSPQRIIIGGGVAHQPQIMPLIRHKVQTLLNGYLQMPQLTDGIDRFIVTPGLGDRSGVLGAIALAHETAAIATVD